VSDIDTAVVDSLKALDPKRPIREADILSGYLLTSARAEHSEAFEPKRTGWSSGPTPSVIVSSTGFSSVGAKHGRKSSRSTPTHTGVFRAIL
jgi:hypothetical protein